MAKGALKAVKGLVFLGNILFLLLGMGLVGLGIYAQLHGQTHKIVPLTIPVALIVLGSFVIAVSFFGCCGASVESRCLLVIYFIILFLIIGAQIGVGVGSYYYRQDAENDLHKAWVKADDSARNWTQNALKCCGFNNNTDYPAYNKACPTTYTDGCTKALVDQFRSKLLMVEISAIVVGSIEVIGLIFSGILMCYLPTADDEKQALLRGAYVVNREYA